MIGPALNRAALSDRLSEFLEVERLLLDYYHRLCRRVTSAALRDALEEGRVQTAWHVRQLTRVVASLGVQPTERSQDACAVMHRLRSLDEVHLGGLAATGEMLESLLLLELKSQLDWQLMQQIGQAAGLSSLLDLCIEVRPIKDERIRWLGQQIRRLTVERLRAPIRVPGQPAAIPFEHPPAPHA